jgi:hypothetical protein
MAIVEFVSSYTLFREYVGRRLQKASTNRVLVGLVLANAADDFVKKHVTPSLPYWHYRSGDSAIFVFFGYSVPPFVFGLETTKEQPPTFKAKDFAESVGMVESQSSLQYSGRTTLILTTAYHEGGDGFLDYEWVLDFDIEGLLEQKVIPDVRVLFEDIIRLAKACPADDAVWRISERISDAEKSDAYFSIAGKYIPFLTNARELVKAHTRARVQDRRPDQSAGDVR